MCCGSRRSAWRTAAAQPARRAPSQKPLRDSRDESPPPSPAGPFASVQLRREGAPIRVAGPQTGQIYIFTEAEPVQAVDARDALVLAHSPSFRRL